MPVARTSASPERRQSTVVTRAARGAFIERGEDREPNGPRRNDRQGSRHDKDKQNVRFIPDSS